MSLEYQHELTDRHESTQMCKTSSFLLFSPLNMAVNSNNLNQWTCLSFYVFHCPKWGSQAVGLGHEKCKFGTGYYSRKQESGQRIKAYLKDNTANLARFQQEDRPKEESVTHWTRQKCKNLQVQTQENKQEQEHPLLSTSNSRRNDYLFSWDALVSAKANGYGAKWTGYLERLWGAPHKDAYHFYTNFITEG